MSRFAVGGFQHETNTFAPARTTWTDFVEPDFWPGLTIADSMPKTFAGLNIPIAGAMAELLLAGHKIVPLAWCAAGPSGRIEDVAFDAIAATLLEALRAALDVAPLDGLYLDLHGAAVAESFDDAEAELLLRIRSLAGDDLPISISLDLHANLGREFVDRADIAFAYRTYPHVDMAATGREAARLLMRLAGGWRPAKAFVQIPFLIPEVWQCTLNEPARSLYDFIAEIEREEEVVLSFCAGFPFADIPDCGPSVLAYAADASSAAKAAGRLAEAIAAAEGQFRGVVFDTDAAVAEALRRQWRGRAPIILADVQDNPGGGGNADTVGLLHTLVGHGADAVSALHWAPEVAALATQTGVGGEITLSLGNPAYGPPLHGRATVERLGDGRFAGSGPMYGGSLMDLGPMALLRILGPGRVRIIVGTRKFQAADQSIFRHLGIEPADERIVALKSQVHFRADFGEVSDDILVVRAPGPVPIDASSLPWRRLRPGIRLSPLGPLWSGPQPQGLPGDLEETTKIRTTSPLSLQHRQSWRSQ
jgi:microcystin degradation protein MlrC